VVFSHACHFFDLAANENFGYSFLLLRLSSDHGEFSQPVLFLFYFTVVYTSCSQTAVAELLRFSWSFFNYALTDWQMRLAHIPSEHKALFVGALLGHLFCIDLA